jgi:serine/threonine-protein kinase
VIYFGKDSVDGSDMKNCPTCQGSYPNNYAVCPADGSPLEEVGTWSDGSVIRGKYRVLCKVGQGGMGSVYKALHLAFDELRALKVIAPELLTDDLFVKRFKHEAVITRKLQHPNAVRVDDIDEAEDGRPYIVMEFIEGKSLKKLIREEGPLPPSRVLAIIKQAANALDAANRLGMVHRDIKPDNIALVDSPEGEMVKVLDFGIAKMKEARMGESAGLTLTGAGVVIGTPQYMSPEQAMGKRGDELDGRADLYSLGVVMYQMLTADLPFKADTTMEMLLAHMQKPPAPIGTLHPELQVPENVAALTMRLLEKNRDLRPPSARALIQEIDKIEKEIPAPQKTRIVGPEDLMRANESRAASGGGRGAAGPAVPPRPQSPPPRPVEIPKPVPPAPVRPQPQVVAPPPRPKPAESRWGMWAALIVLLLGIGGGGLYIAMHDKDHNTPTPVAGPPTATLSADPATVVKGQSVTLNWSSQNATDLDLEPGVGKVKAAGSQVVTPQESTTYTLTAAGPGGTQSPTAHISVTNPSPGPNTPVRPVKASLTSEPARVEKGQSVKLIWDSQNATDLDIEPEVGKVPATGSRTVTPQESTTYTLIATGPGGSQHPSTRVMVTNPPQPPPGPNKDVKAALTLGKFLASRFEYDDAIATFQKGLRLDPSNPELRQELDKTIKACKKENAILNEGQKCGGN